MKRSKKHQSTAEEYDGSSGEEEQQERRVGGRPKKQKSKQLKWSGIFILALFVAPALLGAAVYLSDYLYPEAAKLRRIRDPLVRCYSTANPKKVSEVDHLLNKYKGNEQRLYAQIRKKYGDDFPECRIFP